MNVTIIGLGLIGGSIGLALREARFGAVSGYDRRAEVVQRALERGAIDRGAASIAEAAGDADLVVLATPPLAVRDALAELAPVLGAQTVVTDVASTKQHVVEWARELLAPGSRFVGGHPMAGSERHGIDSARADLFRGAVYCLAPDGSAEDAVEAVRDMVAALGAVPHLLTPAEHDAAVAAVSHLPFVAAAALVETALAEQLPARHRLAAAGFRDTTRTASGDPVMHRDICIANAGALRPLLLDLARRLEEVAARLDDPDLLLRFFSDARDLRDDWRQGAGETGRQGDRETGRQGDRGTR